MKTYKNIYKVLALLVVVIVATSCERGLSDDVEFASFPTSPDIFIDAPVGLTDQFFESFDPAEGYNTEAFDTDDDVAFDGTSSIRIDVPAPNNPDGFQVGGIFRDRGDGRDLTSYDALTFWIRGSTTAVIAEFGFGTDFIANRFATKVTNVTVTTNWQKVIIPIPDPSRLIQEKGMFSFIAGTLSTGGAGFTFWMDEIRFENLGTIAQPRPRIYGGQNIEQEGFTGTTLSVTDITQTFSTADGDVTTTTAPEYFEFSSSDTNVAIVSESGEISVVGVGTTTITAQLAGVLAEGSLTLNVGGAFDSAPEPPAREAEDVISIFSDAYTSVNDLNFAAFNDANVQIETQNFGGDNIVNYNGLEFVGLGWDGTVDLSNMTHMHLDVQITSAIGSSFIVQLIDYGANNTFDGNPPNNGDDTGGGSTQTSQLQEGTWVGIDIPISGFTEATGGGFAGSPNLSNIARVVLVSDGGSFAIDNIYFYREQ